ncbi:MAG: hypothetical protein IPL55_19155 [Saprospiraceae bacterium]|nr:hypothetical protein [Saprospiraceae bacterium]
MDNEQIIAELLKVNASINAIYRVLIDSGLTTIEQLKQYEQEVVENAKMNISNVKATDEEKQNVIDNLG